MAVGRCEADSAGERLKRLGEGAEEVRGEVREVLARGIELQRRGLVGAADGGVAAQLGSTRALAEEGGAKMGTAPCG